MCHQISMSHFLLFVITQFQIIDFLWNIRAICGLELHNPLFLALREVQKHLCGLIGGCIIFHPPTLSPHRQSIASLLSLYHYFNRKCPGTLQFFVPPVQTFNAKTLTHAMYSEAHHPPSLPIHSASKKFHSDIFSPRVTILRNKLPRRCFCNYNNFNLFTSRLGN